MHVNITTGPGFWLANKTTKKNMFKTHVGGGSHSHFHLWQDVRKFVRGDVFTGIASPPLPPPQEPRGSSSPTGGAVLEPNALFFVLRLTAVYLPPEGCTLSKLIVVGDKNAPGTSVGYNSKRHKHLPTKL